MFLRFDLVQMLWPPPFSSMSAPRAHAAIAAVEAAEHAPDSDEAHAVAPFEGPSKRCSSGDRALVACQHLPKTSTPLDLHPPAARPNPVPLGLWACAAIAAVLVLAAVIVEENRKAASEGPGDVAFTGESGSALQLGSAMPLRVMSSPDAAAAEARALLDAAVDDSFDFGLQPVVLFDLTPSKKGGAKRSSSADARRPRF